MKKISILFLLIFISITLTGCSLSDFSFSSGKNVGGIFKSYDFGEKWSSKNLAKNSQDKNINLNSYNTTVIKIDPQNHSNIYLGTRNNGVWYSNTASENWQNILSKGSVYDIALDQKNSGVLYVSLGKQILKSIDLGKNWQNIYSEERDKVVITKLESHPNDNLIFYFGTSKGEIYQTNDGGESWKVILEADDDVAKILINPKNTNIIYVATLDDGIYKTINAGKTWGNLNEIYLELFKDEPKKETRGLKTFRDLIFEPGYNDAIMFASNYGIIKSRNGGNTWTKINLLTPANSVAIQSLAINSQNKKQIYYSTTSSLYRTFDGGETWLTSKLSTNKTILKLIVDFQTPNVIYAGLANIK